ncbi:MAG: adenosine kinase [Rickettsiales bacterium]
MRAVGKQKSRGGVGATMTSIALPTGRRFDVVGLGNAIVDVLAETPADFPEKNGYAKGAMRLLDSEDEARRCAASLRQTGKAVVRSGGSAANTVCGLTLLGKNCAFIGKVANDILGGEFAEDLRRSGVHFDSERTSVAATGQCCIAVTPDGERSMMTYLGAARMLMERDIDRAPIDDAAALYIETYLWDEGDLQSLIRRAIDRAKKAGARVALSLSDPFCVERHRASLFALLESGAVNVLFGNRDEYAAMFDGQDDDALAEFFKTRRCLAFRTLGANGAGVFWNGEYVFRPALSDVPVVDVTGAGDLFAAGALFALSEKFSLSACVDAGIAAASHVIGHLGGRANNALHTA